MPEVDKIIDFEIPKLSPSIIMVTGVGGGGSNAVNHMFEMEIADVSFMVCNTDPQALRNSPVPVKVRLGQNGLGAGNNPEKGPRLCAHGTALGRDRRFSGRRGTHSNMIACFAAGTEIGNQKRYAFVSAYRFSVFGASIRFLFVRRCPFHRDVSGASFP